LVDTYRICSLKIYTKLNCVTLLVSGFSCDCCRINSGTVYGPKYCGVFPLRGNVRSASLESDTQQKENELLCKARNSRKSSHASLVATQHIGKHISAAVSRHATIAATFSERSALTVLRVSDSRVYRRDRRQFCREYA
jgi:hypothetical protein